MRRQDRIKIATSSLTVLCRGVLRQLRLKSPSTVSMHHQHDGNHGQLALLVCCHHCEVRSKWTYMQLHYSSVGSRFGRFVCIVEIVIIPIESHITDICEEVVLVLTFYINIVVYS